MTASDPAAKPILSIGIPAIAAADDAALVLAVVRLANEAFIESEAGIWREGYNRTTEEEVRGLIRDGQLALGYFDSSSQGRQLVACACIGRSSPTLAHLGMLALDRRYWGLGLGRDLMAFVEQHCLEMGCSTMELEILTPTAYAHPFKTRMQAWYQRRGYQAVKLASFEDEYPALAALLAGPVEFRVFEKKLA